MVDRVASSEHDLEAIRAVESAYDAAWRQGDLESLLACFTEDAVVVSPRGEVAARIAEIRDRLGGFLRGPARGSSHTSRLVRVSLVTADVAVVDGEARVEGAGAEFASGSLVHRFTDVLVRRNGRWVIAHVRAYGLVEGDELL